MVRVLNPGGTTRLALKPHLGFMGGIVAAAGDVSERNPAQRPIRNANKSVIYCPPEGARGISNTFSSTEESILISLNFRTTVS